jgi:hypothetical protein
MTELTGPHAETAAKIRGAIGLITEDEAAAVLLLNSAGTLATWRGQGKGPQSVKLGKKVFYSTAGLVEWVTRLNHEQNTPSEQPAKAA